jgi:hypothetical protein
MVRPWVERQLELGEQRQREHEASDPPRSPAPPRGGPVDGPERPWRDSRPAGQLRELEVVQHMAVDHIGDAGQCRPAPADPKTTGEQIGAKPRHKELGEGIQPKGVAKRHSQEDQRERVEEGDLPIVKQRRPAQDRGVPEWPAAMPYNLVGEQAPRVDLTDRIGGQLIIDRHALVGVAPGVHMQQRVERQEDLAKQHRPPCEQERAGGQREHAGA